MFKKNGLIKKLLLILFLLLVGRFIIWPFIPKPYIEHPNLIRLTYLDDPNWWDYKTLSLVRQRVNSYLDQKPNMSPENKKFMEEFSFRKGMNQEQISVIIGAPRKINTLNDGSSLWVYSGVNGGMLQWYYKWGKLKFSNGILTDIEVQYVHMINL